MVSYRRVSPPLQAIVIHPSFGSGPAHLSKTHLHPTPDTLFTEFRSIGPKKKNVCGPADSSPWDAAQIPSKHLIPPTFPPTLSFPYANLLPKTFTHPRNIQGRAKKRCAAMPRLLSSLSRCCSSKLRNRSRPPVQDTSTVRPPTHPRHIYSPTNASSTSFH